jgi:hypothetical protein
VVEPLGATLVRVGPKPLGVELRYEVSSEGNRRLSTVVISDEIIDAQWVKQADLAVIILKNVESTPVLPGQQVAPLPE